ncbi:hypothetical protein HW555_013621, partial [Spodoptera exigua]
MQPTSTFNTSCQRDGRSSPCSGMCHVSVFAAVAVAFLLAAHLARCRSRLSPKFDTNHTSQSDDLKVHEINIDTTKRLLPHVLVDSPVAEIPLSLLVDSGSAICLLKHSSISKYPRLTKEPIKLKGIDPGDEPTTTEDPLALNDNDLLPLPEIEPTPESSKILKENTENNLPSTTGCSSTPDAPATTPLVQQPNANPEIVNDLPDLFDDNYPAFLKTIARKDNISFNTVIQEHNEDITKSKYKIIILPTSIDLDESNPYIQNIIDNLPNSSEIIHKERSLNSSAQGQPNQSFIEPINSSSGLYFDYLGKLRINNIELNIVIPVDISHFKPHIDNIKSALSVTEELCKQTRIIEITSTCYNNLKPLIVRFQDMSRELTSISHLIDNRTKRSAWISGAGTILKKIFGTLDENDGLQYDEAIKTLQLNEKKLASLIKENILPKHFAPAIATPTQLHKELADNYRHLPSDLELPVPLDVKSIYIILSISNNKVIFILQVPMVKTQEYALFHNIALPTPHNTSNPNSFSLILPDYKYLAMTKDKSFYCTFNSLEICKT